MERLLTIDQLSELLQVKKNTIYSWTFTRRIPFVKIGGGLRFRKKRSVHGLMKRRKKVESSKEKNLTLCLYNTIIDNNG